MLSIDSGDIRGLIEAGVTAVSVLGSAMAYESGCAANKATSENLASSIVAERINIGLGAGFYWGRPTATFCLILHLWI